MSAFLQRLNEPQPLVYDGGIGSELFARGVELANSALACQSHPQTVIDIHADYIAAGSDIITTNTFVGSQLHLEMAGKNADEVEELARLAVEQARQARDGQQRDVFIAGSIGPSPGAIEADSGDTDFGIANDLARQAHLRLAEGLAEGGVDFFCLETMFSAKEAALAVATLRQFGLPIAVNLTYKYTKDRATGRIVYRTDWGHSAADLVEILSAGELADGDDLLKSVDILGLNCGAEVRRNEHTGMPYAVTGIGQLRQALEEKGVSGKKLMAYPNAGKAHLDRETRRTYYTQTSEEMQGFVPELVEQGAHLIGGCCGTGPDHIRAFRQIVDGD